MRSARRDAVVRIACVLLVASCGGAASRPAPVATGTAPAATTAPSTASSAPTIGASAAPTAAVVVIEMGDHY